MDLVLNRRKLSWMLLAALLILSTTGLGGAISALEPDQCLFEHSGSAVTLSWVDSGGTHVVRRNGSWLATPGKNVSSFVDTTAPAGATYLVRTHIAGTKSDRLCVAEITGPTTTSTGRTSTSTTSSSTTATEPNPVTSIAPPVNTTEPVPPTTIDPPTATTMPVSVTTSAMTPSECVLDRRESTVTLTWVDTGGTHVVRRDGKWLATPGKSVASFVDNNAPTEATYLVRTHLAGTIFDRDCHAVVSIPEPTTTTTPPQPTLVERVIHVSIDGLRVDHLSADKTPTLSRLITEGASTMNARTDPEYTKTLPNHTSQLTSRAVNGPDGHGVDYNEDSGNTVHHEAGSYVVSVFDVVHDNGGRTLMYAGKPKFDLLDRSWDGVNGAADIVGIDDGSDKIDVYVRTAPEEAMVLALVELSSPNLQYMFFHIRTPDSAGHASGWSGAQYDEAVTQADAILGALVNAVAANPNLAGSTAFIIVSDHGGPDLETLHSDKNNALNYTIPFVVWGPGIAPGADLYALNPFNRIDPGGSQMHLSGIQPIRGHEAGNLALDLLGYSPIPGSAFNASHDLDVG